MEDRAPNDGELLHMQEMLEEGLNAGALRFSSGLFIAPGCFSEPDELHSLGSVLKKHIARYSSHVRDRSHCVREAVAEAIDVGETCGVHVQLVHMKLSGTDNWGEAQLLLDRIEVAREPRRRRALRSISPKLGTTPAFPAADLAAEGGMDAMLARLADPYSRSRVRQKIAEVGFNNFGRLESWEAIRIAISPHGAAEPGQTIADIAKAQNCDELDAVFDIIIADKGSTRILVRCMSEDDVRTIASEPTATVGSDGPCVSPYGVTGRANRIPVFMARSLV